jgi:hypothetical protein
MSYLNKKVENKYEYLVELKKKNGKLNKEYFTDTLLWELYVLEGVTDKKIADLFGLPINKISYLRKKNGIYRR